MRRVVKGSLSKEVTFELNQKEPAGKSSNTQGRRPHVCKGPGAGMNYCSGNLNRQM